MSVLIGGNKNRTPSGASPINEAHKLLNCMRPTHGDMTAGRSLLASELIRTLVAYRRKPWYCQ